MDLSPEVLRGLVQRWARLQARFGGELGERPLVLPNGRFFPDVFQGDQASLERLVSRMQAHAGMADVPITPLLVGADGEGSACGSGGGGCGSCAPQVASDGSFPRLVDQGDGWLLQIQAGEASHPVGLTTAVARALAQVFLFESLRAGERPEEPVEATIDLAGVGLGLGALLLEGSYVYSKSCGGPSVTRLTALSCGELAVVTALFASMRKLSTRAALSELSTTQRAHLAEALEWAASNPDLVEGLTRRPSRVAEGQFRLRDTRPLLVRLFSRRKAPATLEEALERGATDDELARLLGTAPARPAARRPRSAEDDELRRLVEESLAESGAPAGPR